MCKLSYICFISKINKTKVIFLWQNIWPTWVHCQVCLFYSKTWYKIWVTPTNALQHDLFCCEPFQLMSVCITCKKLQPHDKYRDKQIFGRRNQGLHFTCFYQLPNQGHTVETLWDTRDEVHLSRSTLVIPTKVLQHICLVNCFGIFNFARSTTTLPVYSRTWDSRLLSPVFIIVMLGQVFAFIMVINSLRSR